MKAHPVRPITVSVTPEQAAAMQNAVQRGAYASSSEIVREGLRLWERQQEIRAAELAHLKRAYEEGMASGEGRAFDAAALLSLFRDERMERG
ncbi:MAG: type II toxin-antitoxin system ParD family antitoxin [Rhizobiales bacterium]|nr:type II toxin-antitoxin system ParD family antitoxin [Hyphomicrobiales bacterium]